MVTKTKAYSAWFCSLLFYAAFLLACKKQTETLNLPKLADYYPLQPGRMLLYRLDSTHLDATNMQLLVSSYLVKDSLGVLFNDNTGRPTCPVYRFITDTLMNSPWQAMYTYYITETADAAEVVDDNNLRFIKLAEPMVEGFSWDGNSHINITDSTGIYQYLFGWTYTYQHINKPFTVLYGTIDSTATVLEADTAFNPGPLIDTIIQERILSQEVYGKGIGLVYKNFLHWTWDPIHEIYQAQYDPYSYGIKLNLISVK